RPNIFNAAYSVEMGRLTRNKLAGGVLNGWQLSGITQWQSGANLFGSSGAPSMNLNGAKIPGTTWNISNVSLLGTPNIALHAVETCNPAANLAPHQFINASC